MKSYPFKSDSKINYKISRSIATVAESTAKPKGHKLSGKILLIFLLPFAMSKLIPLATSEQKLINWNKSISGQKLSHSMAFFVLFFFLPHTLSSQVRCTLNGHDNCSTNVHKYWFHNEGG